MRIVIQRVANASVTIDSTTCGTIGTGLVILLGIELDDNPADVDWLCAKVANLRVFSDDSGVMNLSVQDISGDILLISQFTLHAGTKKGNRPSYIRAARPQEAIPLYNRFIGQLEQLLGKSIQTGQFGAMMQVQLVNDGPVTIIIDSRNKE